MQGKKTIYHQDQLRDYASLFLRSSVEKMLVDDKKIIDYKIDRYDINWRQKKTATYLDYIKYAYSILVNYYQNEYIYKNSFLNTWLIKELGNSKSIVFNEFRAGKSVADLAIFNGTSKVFEIKTELDSCKRLDTQLNEYNKIFNQIFLVIPQAKIFEYEKYNHDVGLISYCKCNNSFKLQRDATMDFNISSKTIMQILRKNEYLNIVKQYFGFLPEMTSFTMFNKCLELIKEIPLKELNSLFINQIKKRSAHNELSSRYYKELNQVFLSLNMNKNIRRTLIYNLKQPIG